LSLTMTLTCAMRVVTRTGGGSCPTASATIMNAHQDAGVRVISVCERTRGTAS
jgi:hypothetical protein